MKLSKEDVELVYKLHWGLLYYANERYVVIRNSNSPDFHGKNIEDMGKLEDKLFSHPELIDSFIKENPLNFSEIELDIIKGWKNFVKEEFFIFSNSNQTIFLSGKNPKAYEVIGLHDEIQDVIPFEPYYSNAVLLPFKNKIIYSGILQGFNINMGGGMKNVIMGDFIKAKNKFGVISSLDQPLIEKEESYEELLKFYLKNEKNRFEHEMDIDKLLKKDPNLIIVYNQELGKSNARKIRKRLSELNVNSGWFAVLNDVIIASGKNEQEVKQRLTETISEDKLNRVFIFNYKNAK